MHSAQGNSKAPSLTSVGDSRTLGEVQPLLDTIPGTTQPLKVAEGIWWVRLDLELNRSLAHVNVYLLEDQDGWALVDTGTNSESCRSALTQILDQPPFAGKPLARIFITHHHPDHLGLAGWLATSGVEVYATASCINSAREILARSFYATEDQVRFQTQAGLPPIEIESYRRRRLHRYHELVTPLPSDCVEIAEGQSLQIGARTWQIHLGNGHAMDHATFWSNDGLVLAGDQILPGIASNLCVQACEAGLDPVAGWLDSCDRFLQLATAETICLPGHNAPFVGVGKRCQQMRANQEAGLQRLQEHLARPYTAIECIPAVFGLDGNLLERPTLATQVVGYLNYLKNRGAVRCERVGSVNLWSVA